MHGDIILDGLILNGTSRYGECLTTDIPGWVGRPGVKSKDTAADNWDGDIHLPDHNAARTMTITGTLIPSSQPKLQEFTDRLNGLLSGYGPAAGDQMAGGRLQVEWFGSTRWAPVKLNGEILIDQAGPFGLKRLIFTIPLRAPKPQKFGAAQVVTIPSSLSYENVFHRGNTVSYPVVVVSGSAPGGYTMRTVGGTTYTVTRALASGSPHTIDMRNGRLMVGGAYVSGGVSSAGIWRVWSGAPIQVRIQPVTTGAPVMTVTTLDTFI